MKKRLPRIIIVIFCVLLLFIAPRVVYALLPVDLSDIPEVAVGESLEDVFHQLGPATSSVGSIAIWRHENWTLVCGFYDSELRDYHLIDRYNRRSSGTISEKETVWNILQDLNKQPHDLHVYLEDPKVYDAASGVVCFGRIGYDGGIVLFDETNYREVFDYSIIDNENRYPYCFAWEFLLRHLFVFFR